MVSVIKFSEFIDSGVLADGDIVVGLEAGVNSRFTTPTINIDTWLPIASTAQTAAPNVGYVPLNSSVTTITLPATATFGTLVSIAGYGDGGWILEAAPGQTIIFGGLVTSIGGTLESTYKADTVEVLCVIPDFVWTVRNVFSLSLNVT